MNRFLTVAVCGLLLFLNCKETNETDSKPEGHLINEAIKRVGGSEIDASVITFDFRGKQYIATRHKGEFQLERYFKDSLHSYKDVLSNSGFQRFKNNSLIKVPDSMAIRYSNSINSVHYFSVLPYGLNDASVIKTDLGKTHIKGKDYHKIKITFKEEGGGTDFDDVFVYWINTTDFKVDYLAYEFHVNGGGVRFREAYNERYINGIRFVDYNNYKSKNDSSVLDLDRMFESDQLELLSKIELKNITVKTLK